MKALVVFGSKSDSKVYESLVRELKKLGIEVELKIASAHRNPEEVDKIVESNANLIIAGAGLSAALPGAIAAKTVKPVIGVPVKGNYEGLDALLSIVQMPSGIPVLAVGIEMVKVAAENAAKCLKSYSKVTIIGDKKEKFVQKAVEILDLFNIEHEFQDEANPNHINIEFTYFDEPIEKKDELVIYVPLLLKKDDKAEAALNLLKHSDHGLWVGLNRGENAALAAIEIMNINGDYDIELEDYRQKKK